MNSKNFTFSEANESQKLHETNMQGQVASASNTCDEYILIWLIHRIKSNWCPELEVHCRPDITRMSGFTTSDRVTSESRYTEVFYYITNGIQSWPRTYIFNYLPKSTVSQQISYEIGVHTQTALYLIPRYIGSRFIGSTVYCDSKED